MLLLMWQSGTFIWCSIWQPKIVSERSNLRQAPEEMAAVAGGGGVAGGPGGAGEPGKEASQSI